MVYLVFKAETSACFALDFSGSVVRAPLTFARRATYPTLSDGLKVSESRLSFTMLSAFAYFASSAALFFFASAIRVSTSAMALFRMVGSLMNPRDRLIFSYSVIALSYSILPLEWSAYAFLMSTSIPLLINLSSPALASFFFFVSARLLINPCAFVTAPSKPGRLPLGVRNFLTEVTEEAISLSKFCAPSNTLIESCVSLIPSLKACGILASELVLWSTRIASLYFLLVTFPFQSLLFA